VRVGTRPHRRDSVQGRCLRGLSGRAGLGWPCARAGCYATAVGVSANGVVRRAPSDHCARAWRPSVSVIRAARRERQGGDVRSSSSVVAVVLCVFLLVAGGCKASQVPSTNSGGAGARGTAPTSTTASHLATSPPVVSQPTTSEVVSAAKDLVYARDKVLRDTATVRNIALVRDARGQWWATCEAVPPATAKLEYVSVYMYKDANSGTWRLFDYGTGIDPSELPTDVQRGL
jgi:hypothetical protein